MNYFVKRAFFLIERAYGYSRNGHVQGGVDLRLIITGGDLEGVGQRCEKLHVTMGLHLSPCINQKLVRLYFYLNCSDMNHGCLTGINNHSTKQDVVV